MPPPRPVRLASVTALLCVLLGLLTACGGGAAQDAGASPEPVPASVTPSTDSGSAAAKEDGDQAAAGNLTTLGSGVSRDAAAGYSRALAGLRPAFDSFMSDYADAMERMDAADMRTAAASLRRAVVAFDTSVRGLDLSAIQAQLDDLLLLNRDFITTLADVDRATSGSQAVRIMGMLSFRDYVLAFEGLADAL